MFTHIHTFNMCSCASMCTVLYAGLQYIGCEYIVALKYYMIVFRAELIAPLASLANMYQQTHNWLNAEWALPSSVLSHL